MKKRKVYWKVIFKGTDLIFKIDDEIDRFDTFEDKTIISTRSFNRSKAIRKAYRFCMDNGYVLANLEYQCCR